MAGSNVAIIKAGVDVARDAARRLLAVASAIPTDRPALDEAIRQRAP